MKIFPTTTLVLIAALALPLGSAMAATATAKAETSPEVKAEYDQAVGVIAGGAIGAVLGNQVGGGFGKDLATLAGAAGGAYAGKVIEEKMKTHTVWTVTVHYANDSKSAYEFATDPGIKGFTDLYRSAADGGQLACSGPRCGSVSTTAERQP